MLVLCLSGSLFAQVRIIRSDIPDILQKDGMGSYDKIIKEVLGKTELETKDLFPYARALIEFFKCQNCCIVPGTKDAEFSDFYKFGVDFVQTAPINIAKAYIFVKPDQPPINHLADLRDKRVGARIGMPYGNDFETVGLNTSMVLSIEQNIKMIERDRIEAFIAYTPDVYHAFSKYGVLPYPHDVYHPITIHPDSLVCRGVESEFILNFNNALNQLKISGRLKEVLNDSFIFE
jgi:hypothetical protein